MAKVADTAHKSCEVTTDPQTPGARDYCWRHIMDHLRPGGVEVGLFEKFGHSKAAMHMQEFRKTHSCPGKISSWAGPQAQSKPA